MKKLLLFFAAAVMAVSFNACSEETDPDGEKNPTEGDNGGNDSENTDNEEIPVASVFVAGLKVSTGAYFNGNPEYEITVLDYDDKDRVIRYNEDGHIYPFIYDGKNKVTIERPGNQNYYAHITLNAHGDIEDITCDNAKSHFKYSGRTLTSCSLEYTDDDDSYLHEFTWKDGNIVEIREIEHDGDVVSTYTYTYEYDTTRELPTMNVNIFHCAGINIYPIDLDYTARYAWALSTGRQSKNPVTKVIWKDNGETKRIGTFSYDYNADGSIAAIHQYNDWIFYQQDFNYYITYR